VLGLFPKRAPEVIEIPVAEAPMLAATIHAANAKVFANGWNVDALENLVGHQPKGYLKMWSDGCDIVQTEYPAAALIALGRASK